MYSYTLREDPTCRLAGVAALHLAGSRESGGWAIVYTADGDVEIAMQVPRFDKVSR